MINLVGKLSCVLPLVLVGCASTDPYTGSAQDQAINVQYGTIEGV